jgi:type I restriction-modification system DNA methylase subunit
MDYGPPLPPPAPPKKDRVEGKIYLTTKGNVRYWDGKIFRNKAGTRIYYKNYYKINKNNKKEYYEKNKHERLIYVKEYRKKNKDKIAEKNRIYDKINVNKRKLWRDTKKDKRRRDILKYIDDFLDPSCEAPTNPDFEITPHLLKKYSTMPTSR